MVAGIFNTGCAMKIPTASTTISNLQFKTGGWTLSSDSPTTTLTLLGTGTGTNAALYSATGNNTNLLTGLGVQVETGEAPQ